jgi:hypothetical protein
MVALIRRDHLDWRWRAPLDVSATTAARALVALVIGPIGLVVGRWSSQRPTGPGTGNGIAGGFVAIVVGLDRHDPRGLALNRSVASPDTMRADVIHP